MSKNINQIFTANPASSMQNTDLLYLGRSPYGATNDMAITYANLISSLGLGLNTRIYVDASVGSDTNGSGSAINPYLSITKALSVITDNSVSKPYAIILSGSTTETAISLKPFVSIIGNGYPSSQITISGAGNNVVLDSSWSGVASGALILDGITFSSSNLNFNLNGIAGSSANIVIRDCSIIGNLTYQGRGTTVDQLHIYHSLLSGASTSTMTDVTTTSFNNNWGTTSNVSTNATSTRIWFSMGDVFGSQHSVSETSGNTIISSINASSISVVNVTGATAVYKYDVISLASTINLSSGGTATALSTANLQSGGTNASLIASNGGIFYSTGSAAAILSGTATANQTLLSGSSSAPVWSTATYPATTTINQILYSSSANTIVGLATANNGTLITSAGGVPSISSTLPSAVQGNITSAGVLTATSLQNTPIGSVTRNSAQVTTLDANSTATKTGTVTTSNLVVNSGTTNVSNTSASTTVNLNYGAISEVAFSSLCSSSATAASGWTSNYTLQANSFGGPQYFYLTTTANHSDTFIDYATPNNLGVGVYKLEYRLQMGTNCPKIDVSAKINGNVTYNTALRSQIDLYTTATANGVPHLGFIDYFTITTAGSANIRFTVNGKNASSSDYLTVLMDCLRITQLG